MAEAIWHGRVLAESDHTREVEGYRYFPPESITRDAAWYYPHPSPAVPGSFLG